MPPRHVALAVIVAVVWGVNFVVIDVGLETFPPLLFAALRFALVLVPAVFLLPRPRVPLRWLAGVGLFTLAGQFALVFSSLEAGMPAGLASLVLQLQAVFTIGFGVLLLGERPALRVLVGAAIALAGMAVIGAGRGGHVPLTALALCVGAAASWGMGNVCTRRAQAANALALTVWASLFALPVLVVASLVLEGPGAIGEAARGIDLAGVGALLYVVVGSTLFGFGVWGRLLREHPVNVVAPFTLLVPPVGIASAWLLLGERPNVAELLGAVVVLAGLAMTTGLLRTRGMRAREAARRDVDASGGGDAAQVPAARVAP